MRWPFFIFIGISLTFINVLPVLSQERDDELQVIEYLTDNNAFRDLIENNGQEIFDIILSPYNSKIDINTITLEELRANFFLNENQIINFFNYREKYGPIRSIYELQVIEGFDREIISLFLLGVSSPASLNIQSKKVKVSQTFSTGTQWLIQKKKGFTDQNKFKGDPFKVFTRYSLNVNNKVLIGFTGEKDQGEYFTIQPSENKFLFDHYSAFIQVKNIGKISDLIIGDFSMQTGQGLVFSQPFSFGKGAETITSIRKSGNRLRPVSSSYEFKSFSGIAANLRFNNFNLTTFASHVNRDATIRTEPELNFNYIRSINQSGLHRTETELENENTLYENSFGLNADLFSKRKNFNIGVNLLQTTFSLPFYHLKAPENKFKFRGTNNQNASTYLNYYLPNTHFFSEIGASKNGGIGMVSGLIHQIKESLFLSIYYRNLSPKYHSFHGNVFSEKSNTSNEKGLYLGLKFSPFRNSIIGLYHDSFSFPYLTASLSKSSHGSEWMTFFRYQQYKSYAFNIKLSYLTYENKDGTKTTEPFIPNQISQRLRIDVLGKIIVSDFLELTQHLKWSRIDHQNNFTNGFLMSTGFRLIKDKLSLTTSFNLFQTDDYYNRIYQFQPGIPHGYLYPFFFDNGSSINFLINYRFNEKTRLWLNYNQVVFNDAKTIGSGQDQIIGNKKTIVSLELIVNF